MFEGEGAAAKRHLDKALHDIDVLVRGRSWGPFAGRTERVPLGLKLNVQSARGKTTVLLLLNGTPLLADETRVDVDTLLDSETPFLARMVTNDSAGNARASPGNRFVLSNRQIAEVRRVLKAPQSTWNAVERIATSHLIDETAWSHLRRGSGVEFIQARRKLMDDLEDEWLARTLRILRAKG